MLRGRIVQLSIHRPRQTVPYDVWSRQWKNRPAEGEESGADVVGYKSRSPRRVVAIKDVRSKTCDLERKKGPRQDDFSGWKKVVLTIPAANEVPLLTTNPDAEGPFAQTMTSPGAHAICAISAAPCENLAMVPSSLTAPATIKGKFLSRAHFAGTVSNDMLR